MRIGFRAEEHKEQPPTKAPVESKSARPIALTIHIDDGHESSVTIFPAHLVRGVTLEPHDDDDDGLAVADTVVPPSDEMLELTDDPEPDDVAGHGAPVVRQRKEGDCGVAALAMVLEISYEDAYVAVSQVDRANRGGSGLYQKDLIAAAATLRRKLVRKRKVDLDEDEGILSIIWNKKGAYHGHYVALRRGLVFDPGLDVPMDHHEWFRLNDGRPGTILIEEDT